MIRKVFKAEVTCDRCNKQVMHEHVQYVGDALPDGWHSLRIPGCGMTDYEGRSDVCPECFAAHRVGRP